MGMGTDTAARVKLTGSISSRRVPAPSWARGSHGLQRGRVLGQRAHAEFRAHPDPLPFASLLLSLTFPTSPVPPLAAGIRGVPSSAAFTQTQLELPHPTFPILRSAPHLSPCSSPRGTGQALGTACMVAGDNVPSDTADPRWGHIYSSASAGTPKFFRAGGQRCEICPSCVNTGPGGGRGRRRCGLWWKSKTQKGKIWTPFVRKSPGGNRGGQRRLTRMIKCSL